MHSCVDAAVGLPVGMDARFVWLQLHHWGGQFHVDYADQPRHHQKLYEWIYLLSTHGGSGFPIPILWHRLTLFLCPYVRALDVQQDYKIRI